MENYRIKILFLTFEYGKTISGGIGRVINSLVPPIRDKVELQVMSVRNYRSIKLTRFRDKISIVKYYYFSIRLFQPEMLIPLIEQEKYDIIHIFHLSTLTAAVVKTIKSRFPRLPIIYSCHSIAKYESVIRNVHPDLLPLEDLIINQADHLHLLNQSSLKYLQKAYPLVDTKKTYSIIPNGIEADSFPKKATRFARKINGLHLNGKITDGRITVLCMSRWSWGKGLEYLLDAIPEVTSHYPNIQFIITGKKQKSWEYHYREYLHRIDQKIAGLADYAILLGWMNDSQRSRLCSLADIWVMPSELEYFPYSILEPMMDKIPIISSRIDSVTEMLRANEDCLFYEPHNPHQLAERILTLIHNPNLRRELAENAYRKAQEFQWSRIVEMYLEMYQTVSNQVLSR